MYGQKLAWIEIHSRIELDWCDTRMAYYILACPRIWHTRMVFHLGNSHEPIVQTRMERSDPYSHELTQKLACMVFILAWNYTIPYSHDLYHKLAGDATYSHEVEVHTRMI